MIKEIIFSNKKYIAVDVIRATKKIKGNNNTNRAFLYRYDSKTMSYGGELWGNSTTPLTIGKQVTVGGILYDEIVECDSNPEAVGFYVYDSDLENYNWGGKPLLNAVLSMIKYTFTSTEKGVRAC